MKLIVVTMLTLAQMVILSTPEDYIQLEGYDFDDRHELVDLLLWTRNQIDDRIDQAQQDNNQCLVDRLEQEKILLTQTINMVDNAQANAWGGVLDQTKYQLIKVNRLLNCQEE